MNVNYEKPSLSNEFLQLGYKNESKLYEGVDVSSITGKLDSCLGKAATCKETIDNYDSISDDMFKKTIDELCTTEFETKDYLNIVSLKEGKRFDKIQVIHTNMLPFRKAATRMSFICAVNSEYNLYTDWIMTKNEVKALVDRGLIVLLKPEEEVLNMRLDTYDEYNDNEFTVYRKEDFTQKDGRLYKYTLQYFRNIFTTEAMRNHLNSYLEQIEDELGYMILFGKENNNYRNISKTLERKVNDNYKFRLSKLR